MRRSGIRADDQLRDISITPGYLDFAEGSWLITWGRTRVLCVASVSEQVPSFRLHSGGGWVTAEYAMLPGATHPRGDRVSHWPAGRPHPGDPAPHWPRPWAVVDLQALGPCTVTVDCDVIQTDGGTRTASITGGFIALCLALENLRRQGLSTSPIREPMAAVSVGLIGERLLLDLDYDEDSQAQVDANFVGTGKGELIEVQLTREGGSFPAGQLNLMLDLAQKGIKQLIHFQKEILAPWLPLPW